MGVTACWPEVTRRPVCSDFLSRHHLDRVGAGICPGLCLELAEERWQFRGSDLGTAPGPLLSLSCLLPLGFPDGWIRKTDSEGTGQMSLLSVPSILTFRGEKPQLGLSMGLEYICLLTSSVLSP